MEKKGRYGCEIDTDLAISNRRIKSSVLWLPAWWDDPLVALGDAVRKHGNQLSGQACGDLGQ